MAAGGSRVPVSGTRHTNTLNSRPRSRRYGLRILACSRPVRQWPRPLLGPDHRRGALSAAARELANNATQIRLRSRCGISISQCSVHVGAIYCRAGASLQVFFPANPTKHEPRRPLGMVEGTGFPRSCLDTVDMCDASATRRTCAGSARDCGLGQIFQHRGPWPIASTPQG